MKVIQSRFNCMKLSRCGHVLCEFCLVQALCTWKQMQFVDVVSRPSCCTQNCKAELSQSDVTKLNLLVINSLSDALSKTWHMSRQNALRECVEKYSLKLDAEDDIVGLNVVIGEQFHGELDKELLQIPENDRWEFLVDSNGCGNGTSRCENLFESFLCRKLWNVPEFVVDLDGDTCVLEETCRICDQPMNRTRLKQTGMQSNVSIHCGDSRSLLYIQTCLRIRSLLHRISTSRAVHAANDNKKKLARGKWASSRSRSSTKSRAALASTRETALHAQPAHDVKPMDSMPCTRLTQNIVSVLKLLEQSDVEAGSNRETINLVDDELERDGADTSAPHCKRMSSIDQFETFAGFSNRERTLNSVSAETRQDRDTEYLCGCLFLELSFLLTFKADGYSTQNNRSDVVTPNPRQDCEYSRKLNFFSVFFPALVDFSSVIQSALDILNCVSVSELLAHPEVCYGASKLISVALKNPLLWKIPILSLVFDSEKSQNESTVDGKYNICRTLDVLKKQIGVFLGGFQEFQETPCGTSQFGVAKTILGLVKQSLCDIEATRKAYRGVKLNNVLIDVENSVVLGVHRSGVVGASLIEDPRDCEKVTEELKKRYEKQIGLVQFETQEQLAHTFCLFREAAAVNDSTRQTSSGQGSNSRMLRINREISALSSSLPLNFSTSIAVRVDESRYDCLRACIVGPENTPYENGLFSFDIFLPESFPNRPPLTRFLTSTHNGTRLNPNLYPNGKVCLSLLGTWHGPGWNSSCTLLQVLVSIQSLILNSNPLFNEPGYERFQNTASGNTPSMKYNHMVRKLTVKYTITSTILNPPYGFADLVTRHFSLKRNQIRAQVRKWRAEAYEFVEGCKKDQSQDRSSSQQDDLLLFVVGYRTMDSTGNPTDQNAFFPYLTDSDVHELECALAVLP
uniref:UBC core domain-containing protein n=1 Tax=Timspurckia oligopyrenoides TaxID=708627 RepID=A0A7S1EPV6_9RHOD